MNSHERNSIRAEVIDAVASIARLDPKQIREDMSLSEAKIDSLGLVEAVFEIENRFNIAIPFNANERDRGPVSLRTIGQLVDQVVEVVMSNAAVEAEAASEAFAGGMFAPAIQVG